MRRVHNEEAGACGVVPGDVHVATVCPALFQGAKLTAPKHPQMSPPQIRIPPGPGLLPAAWTPPGHSLQHPILTDHVVKDVVVAVVEVPVPYPCSW